MGNYLLRRLLLTIPTLILVALIVFIALRLIPGSIVDLMAGAMESTSNMDQTNIRQALGLDVPIYQQFFRWAGNIVLHGSLGNSLWSSTPVVEEILGRLPVTIELILLATILSTGIAIPLGIFSAIRQDTKIDYIARSLATGGIALPSFWVGTLVVVFGSIWFNWSPSIRIIPFGTDPLRNLGQFIIPAVILGLHGGGTDMRLTRSMVLDVMRQDYIRTAWEKGLRERTVVLRHALKNALMPVVTNIGLHIPTRIAGAVILETIFGLPGVGRLIVDATKTRDYTIVSGVVLFIAIIVLLMNILVDATYGYLDPRIRYK